MPVEETDTHDLPKCNIGIGVVGAGFIVRDCHLVAYADAGFRVAGITSRTIEAAREVAALRQISKVYPSLEEMLDDPAIEVVDVAVPPNAQPAVIRRILAHPRRMRGILAQKPLAMSYAEAATIVNTCELAGVVLQVNQNMRYDPSVRALKTLLDRGELGRPVLATIELRAIPHWMPWAREGRSLSTFVMSIHHLDTFRYWLGDPLRVLASTRPDPRTPFPHEDGINLYILEYENGARASGWDDVWSGPARGSGVERDREMAFRRDRGNGSRRDRLALVAGSGAEHDRLYDDPQPGCLAPTAIVGELVPGRICRYDGRSAEGPGNGQGAGHLRSGQSQDDRALRGRPVRGARRRRRAAGRIHRVGSP